jgi:amidophosphoribosyltransferase
MTGSLNERCGIVGIFNDTDAAENTFLGLYALQHRGQESSGIAVSDTQNISIHKDMGLVRQVFANTEVFNSLPGIHAIGHNRYSTYGSSSRINAQPILINCRAGQIAGAHNGNLTNAESLRRWMENDGSIFMSTTDTELIMHLIARSKRETIDEMILDALGGVKGAYSILFLTSDALYGARDPRGFRPLLLGKKNESYVLSSETCAFDLIGAEMLREIEPGEMIKISADKIMSLPVPTFESVAHYSHCVFEFIYFSRPDSYVFGENVDKVRRGLGRQLAREHPAPDADLVIGIPDSATTAALGYAEESGIKFDIGLIRNHYVGRTFIHPGQSGRDYHVRLKFNTVRGVLKGKKIVLVDDSIVRGTTMKKIIQLIKTARPAEIHLRIASPPIIAPCFMGIDMPTKHELIASGKTIEEIEKFMEVDSLGYLSVNGMLQTVPAPKANFCAACFTEDYPVAVSDSQPHC